jgi:hypothetical protein
MEEVLTRRCVRRDADLVVPRPLQRYECDCFTHLSRYARTAPFVQQVGQRHCLYCPSPLL